MKKIIIPIILCILIGGGVYFYNRVEHAENSEDITLYGNVDIRDVALGFRVSGRIEKLNYEEGDSVKTGDVMALLDKKPFQNELSLRQAELNEAQASLTNAEKLYSRISSLVKTGSVSQGDYDDALARRDEARARVKTAQARVDLAQTNLDDTEIHAPNDGTILTRVREEGSIVGEGQFVYTLALQNPVWVRTYVDEPFLGEIYEGQTATVTTDSGDRYEGQVGFISPQAEFTPKSVETTQLRTDLVFRLRVIVDNPDKGLRQGMPVTVKIEKRTSDK